MLQNAGPGWKITKIQIARRSLRAQPLKKAAYSSEPPLARRDKCLAPGVIRQAGDGDSGHALAVLSALEQSDAHLERMERIEPERTAAVVAWLRAPVALAQDEFEAMYGELEAWGDEQNDDA
jgi:hypothetical protein